MNIIAVPYGSEHQQQVRIGDTLRILVKKPTGDTWTGNVAIKTSLSATATDDVALSAYSGGRVQNQNWDLYKDYSTSSLTAGEYLAVAELTSGSINVEYVTRFSVLEQGR